MMLVEIQEEFMAIILDIHLWRMLLDFAITCGNGLSQKKKVEEMKIMDEEYHQLFKDLRRESHALQEAAVEDKGTIILRISRIVDLHGSTSGLDYLRAIYLQSWLTGSAASKDMELRKYEYVDVLGQGGCGIVLKVKWLGVECALKRLPGQDEKEASALKGLFHPNIIRLFHYWEDCPEDPQSRLLMELMPQDLGAYMRGVLKGMSSSKMQMGKDSMPFSLPVAIDIMYQIAQAMRYMHEKHLTHRDLKPANILVKERPQVGLTCIDGAGYLDIKLADFGLVKSYNNTSTFQAPSRNKGTGMYRAPEIFGKDMTHKRHYLPMADVWSFGITCAEILSGKEAYAEYVGNSGMDIPSMICNEGLRPFLPKHCPQYLAFCIKSCWEFLPSRRPTFVSLCKLLRHAKLLSLGVTKLDDSKFFFAYTTRSDQVQSLNLSPLSSKARISTFFQSSLKFMGIGPRPVPNVAKALPATAIVHEVRLFPTPLITEDSPELNEDIGGGIATPGSLIEGERHYSAVLPVADSLQEKRVVSTLMVTEESPLANEDIADSISTLANPTQRIKSLPDLQEPAQLTQASLGNNISPPDASDPIQPAIIPISGQISIMSKKQGRAPRCAIICGIEENADVNPTGNHPKKNSVRKNKKPGGVLSHFQDLLKGKSAEPELSKSRTVDSASNSPTALSYRSLVTSIKLPKPPPPFDLEVIRNNGSQEADGYQFQAPPPGSYQDGDTGPSPKNLLMAVMGVKSAVNHFSEVLIMDMNKHLVEQTSEYLVHTILREVRSDMDSATLSMSWEFLVQAFICKRFFDGFDAPNRYFGIDYFENDQMTKLISYVDFSKFKDLEATVSMLLNSYSPDGSFLGRFCFKKFKSIFGDLARNQPLPIYQEERSVVEMECHPKTMFYQSFLKAAVSVWLLHRLVHSFEEKVEMLIYEKGAKFQRQTMESIVPGSYEEEDAEADVNTEVDFSVIPGFQVSRSVVKCEVYLRNRNRLTDMEITGRTSTKKTHVKTPSNKPLGKTLSGKTSVKPPTPELLVRDNSSPRSLQLSEGFSSSSHYVDHYPPRVGDDGSSGLVVREAGTFWDAQREGLIPGNQGSEAGTLWDAQREGLIPANQGSVNGSGRKNKYERDNFSDTFPGNNGHGTTVYKIRRHAVRSSNQRGIHFVAQDTKVSELRRLTNTRRSFPSV